MRIKLLFLLISLIVIISINPESVSEFHEEATVTPIIDSPSSQEKSLSDEWHDPIIVDGNDGFESNLWQGSGTENDPYILANLNLIRNETSIAILHTNAFFIIENVSLSTGGESYYALYSPGIHLYNVENGILRNLDIREKEVGILVEFSSNLLFENTSFDEVVTSFNIQTTYEFLISDSSTTTIQIWNSQNFNITKSVIRLYGLNIEHSQSIHISDVLFIGHSGYYGSTGLSLGNTHYVTVSDTIFDFHSLAIRIEYSSYLLFIRCQIHESYTAFIFVNNRRCMVNDTIIGEGNIEFHDSVVWDLTYSFNNVTIDSKPIGYFTEYLPTDTLEEEYSYLFLHEIQNIEISQDKALNISKGLILSSLLNVTIKNIITNDLSIDNSIKVTISDSLVTEYFRSSNNFYTRVLDVSTRYITIDRGANTSFSRCQIENIYIWDTVNVSIYSSVISYGEDSGFQIDYSRVVTIEDTLVYGTGIEIQGSSVSDFRHQFVNVTVNDKPLGYFIGMSDTSIDAEEYGQIILVDSRDIEIDSGRIQSTSNPFHILFSSDILVRNLVLLDIEGWCFRVQDSQRLEFQSITLFDCQGGVLLEHVDGVELRSSSLNINGQALYIYNSRHIDISENSIISSWGIGVTDSAEVSVKDNQISSSERSLTIDYNAEVEIIGNRISGGNEGIVVYYSSYWDQDYQLVNIIGNTIYQCSIGIYIEGSYRVFLSGNHILKSWEFGIRLSETYDSVIAFNEIAFTQGIGMQITSSSENQIYGNLFHHNEHENVIESSENIWHSDYGIGNCWDDYDGEGSYQIVGGSNSYDMHPLSVDSEEFSLPLLSIPDDVFVNESSSEFYLSWVVWTDQTLDYVVYLDSVVYDIGRMEYSGVLSIFLNELPQGLHNLTLSIQTESGDMQYDQTTVTIGSALPAHAVTLAVSALVVVSLVLLEIKRRHNLI